MLYPDSRYGPGPLVNGIADEGRLFTPRCSEEALADALGGKRINSRRFDASRSWSRGRHTKFVDGAERVIRSWLGAELHPVCRTGALKVPPE
jgi:hypothetical protein